MMNSKKRFVKHGVKDKKKNKNDDNYRIFNESKNTYIECTPESEAF